MTMAQVIRTLCDVHLEQDEEVEGHGWEVQVRKVGSRTLMREVDLCDECAKVLENVAAFAAEKGRTAQQSPRPAVAAQAAMSASPNGKVACPVDGCTSEVTSNNLARHLAQVHGLAPASGIHPCPDCERTFSRAQGLGAHRYQAHGYVSPTRSERESRAAAS